MLIHGGGDSEVGYRTKCCKIEGTMMGRTVFSYDTGTVETEDDMQVQ
jgi:hypothetical protein